MSDRRYHTQRWRKKRLAQLRKEPLCRFCKQLGKITAATVADHIKPHRGDDSLFWTGALQSLCAECHSTHKQRQEATGKLSGASVDGIPVDANHHWNRVGGSNL